MVEEKKEKQTNKTPKKKRQPNPKIKMKNFVRAMGASWYPTKGD